MEKKKDQKEEFIFLPKDPYKKDKNKGKVYLIRKKGK